MYILVNKILFFCCVDECWWFVSQNHASKTEDYLVAKQLGDPAVLKGESAVCVNRLSSLLVNDDDNDFNFEDSFSAVSVLGHNLLYNDHYFTLLLSTAYTTRGVVGRKRCLSAACQNAWVG